MTVGTTKEELVFSAKGGFESSGYRKKNSSEAEKAVASVLISIMAQPLTDARSNPLLARDSG